MVSGKRKQSAAGDAVAGVTLGTKFLSAAAILVLMLAGAAQAAGAGHPAAVPSPPALSATAPTLTAQSAAAPSPGTDAAAPANLDTPIAKWAGLKFIFLPKPEMEQSAGYVGGPRLIADPNVAIWSPHNDEWEAPGSDALQYDKFNGKTLTVTDVHFDDSLQKTVVTFAVDGMDLKLYATPDNGSVPGLAPLDELTQARDAWLGKTLYSRRTSLLEYNPMRGVYTVGGIHAGDPATVRDVKWGFRSDRPLWVVVEAPGGRSGAIDTAFSWTNIPAAEWTPARPWESAFWSVDPHKSLSWSPEIWNKIDHHQLAVGMTQEQARMSWGAPDRVETLAGANHVEWAYGYQRLEFRDGVLTAIHRGDENG